MQTNNLAFIPIFWFSPHPRDQILVTSLLKTFEIIIIIIIILMNNINKTIIKSIQFYNSKNKLEFRT